MRLIRGIGMTVTALAAGIALPVSAAAASPASVSPASPAAFSVLAQTSSPATPSQAGQPASPASGRLPEAGNPNGHAFVPGAARAVSTSHPTHVIGDGRPASCTSRAVVAAVRAGGVITFSCGPRPVTILMRATAKVRNTSRRVVIDGGGKVTLSGGGVRRILYMNTCDKRQVWTTSHCYNQARPHLVVQNLTLTRGNATGSDMTGGSGGAIYAQGGRLKVVNSAFIDNRCYPTGPDLGGAAIRALAQYRGLPVYIVHSTFRGGICSNGGALSSIGVSWVVLNSVMTRNRDIGWGANPKAPGTPGGGSGGAIYTDGNRYTVKIAGTIISRNHAKEGGGAIFFVSDNGTGTLRISHSTLRYNPSAGFHTAGYPGIFFKGHGQPVIIDSSLS
jgi:hypothetical protein